jgi:aspartyl-tRNA(Asn)/glutamyl-tRNA(Gln) amidotransferase subunit A
LKPTFGRVPYEGIVETTSRTMCHAGPVARSVEDAALVFDAIAAADTAGALVGGDVRGLRLAVAERQSSESLDEDVEAALDEAARLRRARRRPRPRGDPDLLLARATL